MAKSARVVIGAGFGDEGKGLVTDAFAAHAGSDCLVVRFNGGAQAGHMVVTPCGRRHVFSHFGSGTLAGAATWLSRFFLCNPILFLKEWEVLQRAGLRPRVLVDPQAPVTTPYDMMINQAAEEARGAARHGSCGMGIGETVERSLDPSYKITAADLSERGKLRERLLRIRGEYARCRLARLGIQGGHALQHLLSDQVLERFLVDVEDFLGRVDPSGPEALKQAAEVVFEGAQGLLLDQDRGFFPYVTRSHTGIRNVLQLAGEAAIRRLEVTYVTRSYLTRHGAGPLPNEIAGLPHPAVRDDTNRPNPYQGRLRFGCLDLDLLASAIRHDRTDTRSTPEIRVRAGIAVSCMDQLGDRIQATRAGRLKTLATGDFLREIASGIEAAWLYGAYGPSRLDLRDRADHSGIAVHDRFHRNGMSRGFVAVHA